MSSSAIKSDIVMFWVELLDPAILCAGVLNIPFGSHSSAHKTLLWVSILIRFFFVFYYLRFRGFLFIMCSLLRSQLFHSEIFFNFRTFWFLHYHHPAYVRPTGPPLIRECLGCSFHAGSVRISNFTHSINWLSDVCSFPHNDFLQISKNVNYMIRFPRQYYTCIHKIFIWLQHVYLVI